MARVELQRGAVLVEIQHVGRQLFITEGDRTTTRGFFDDDEAAAAFAAVVAAREADGFALTAADAAKRAWQRAEQEHAQQVVMLVESAVAEVDPQVGARRLLATLATAPQFTELISHVVAIDDDGDVRLRGGGSLKIGRRPAPPTGTTAAVLPWFEPISTLSSVWLHLNNDKDHALYFGSGAGPPGEDEELEHTRFADVEVEWFLQELPQDRYWFFASGAAHCFEFDGGLQESFDGPLADLLVSRLVSLLTSG